MAILDEGRVGGLNRHSGETREVCISDIASKLNMNRNMAARYLDLLLISGQVELKTIGTAKVFYLSHRVPVSAMLEFLSDYILMLDKELRVIQLNERLNRLLDEPREALIGKKISEMNNPFFKKLRMDAIPEGIPPDGDRIMELYSETQGERRYFRLQPVPTTFEDGSQGLTLIFEDISEQHAADEKIQQYIAQMEFLSRKLQEFIELPPDADIYDAIGRGLQEILTDAAITVNSYEPGTGVLTVRAVFGERERECIARYFDRPLIGMPILPNEDVPEEVMSGKMYHIRKSLFHILFSHIPADQCAGISEALNLGDFFSIGLIWHGHLFGNMTFALRKGATPDNIPIIETYGKAASVALKRHSAENALRQRGESG